MVTYIVEIISVKDQKTVHQYAITSDQDLMVVEAALGGMWTEDMMHEIAVRPLRTFTLDEVEMLRL